MEECVKDNLHDAIGGLKDYRSALGKANDTMNDALGAISRLEHENKSLRDELERLRALHREETQCMDADGVPINEGDTVYDTEDGEQLLVVNVWSSEQVSVLDDERFRTHASPDRLTHRKPDSWAQLEADATLSSREYYRVVIGCEAPDDVSANGHQRLVRADILRRAKRLAGVEDE